MREPARACVVRVIVSVRLDVCVGDVCEMLVGSVKVMYDL